MAPELYLEDEEGNITEPRLDLVVRWPGDTVSYKLDVAVRSLIGVKAESKHPGEAAARGGSAVCPHISHLGTQHVRS